jgi:hypothetical protein
MSRLHVSNSTDLSLYRVQRLPFVVKMHGVSPRWETLFWGPRSRMLCSGAPESFPCQQLGWTAVSGEISYALDI